MKSAEQQLRNFIREAVAAEVSPRVQPSSVIYCDMDGVLVDFEAGTIKLLNSILDGEKIPGAKRGKSYWKTLRKLHNELGEDWRPQGRPDLNLKPARNFMFAVISENPGGFFGALPPLSDGVNQLWPYLNSTGHTVKLLTAGVPGRSEMPTAEEGKKMWAMENLDPPPKSVILSPARQKAENAAPGDTPNVLIDDKASTIQTWNAAGGIGILHTPGGSSVTIARLQEIGL